MHLSRKRLSFGALVADFYCFGIIAGAIQGLYVAGAHKPVPLWLPVLLMLSGSVGLIVYHTILARSIRRFSPGEVIFGRRTHDGGKWWMNPYRVSRVYLFGLVIIALVSWGNLWDSVSHERFYSTLTFPVVLGRIAFLATGIFGLLLLGRGKPHGAYFVAAVFTISALANLKSVGAAEVSRGITSGIAAVSAAIVLFAVGVGIYYARHLEA